MIDDLRLELSKHLAHKAAILDVAQIKVGPRIHVLAIPPREIIQHRDFMPQLHVSVGHVRRDESCPSGHQNSHECSKPFPLPAPCQYAPSPRNTCQIVFAMMMKSSFSDQ